MSDQLFLLLAGFVLTTVCGGLLGSWFQRNAWDRQEHARLFEAEKEAARAFFEDLSRVFDRRLHRMRELDAWLLRAQEADEVERSLARYREAVDEWNDNLNRMLALAQRYFGQELRDDLDYGVMSRFVEAGKGLEERVREYRKDGQSSLPSLTSDLNSLKDEVYFLNLQLIEAIQHGDVGIFHPDVDSEPKAG